MTNHAVTLTAPATGSASSASDIASASLLAVAMRVRGDVITSLVSGGVPWDSHPLLQIYAGTTAKFTLGLQRSLSTNTVALSWAGMNEGGPAGPNVDASTLSATDYYRIYAHWGSGDGFAAIADDSGTILASFSVGWPSPIDTTSSLGALRIGHHPVGSATSVAASSGRSMTIDWLAIYTATQSGAARFTEPAPTASGLAAYYAMDEGSGSTVADSTSGGGQTLTFSSAPDWVSLGGGSGTTGTGTVTAGGQTVAATGALAFSGTGALAAGGATIAATSVATFTGTGALAAGGATIASTGTEIFTGTGALAAGGQTVAAVGIVTGAGGVAEITVGGGTVASTGALRFLSTGAAEAGGATASSAGSLAFSGTGAAAAGGATAAATGQQITSWVGTGAVAAGGATVGGEGTVPVEGLGGSSSKRRGGLLHERRLLDKAEREAEAARAAREAAAEIAPIAPGSPQSHARSVDEVLATLAAPVPVTAGAWDEAEEEMLIRYVQDYWWGD